MDQQSSHRCNICLKRKKLSIDHIFPQSITKKAARNITSLGHRLGIKDANARSRHAQNGYTQKTICEKCNNQILGLLLDPSLKDLFEKMSKELSYLKFLSGNSIYLTNINLRQAVRAISGHLIANTTKPVYRIDFYRALRRLVLHDKLDKKLRILMWLYPFNDQVIVENIAKLNTKTNSEPVVFKIYKTFPIAFAFIYDNDLYEPPSPALYEITKNPIWMLPKAVNFHMRAKPLMDRVWPEAPFDHEVVLTRNNSGLQTHIHNKKQKYKH